MAPDKLTITLCPRSLLVGGLLSPAAVLLGWWVYSWPWGSNNAPAWVQAIGSIGAILASVWVARFADRRTEQRQQISEEKTKILLEEIAAGTLRSAQGLIEQLDIIKNAGAGWAQVERVVDRESNLLLGFDVLGAPSPKVAKAVLNLRGALVTQRHFLDQLVADSGSTGAFLSFKVQCTKVEKSAASLLEALEG